MDQEVEEEEHEEEEEKHISESPEVPNKLRAQPAQSAPLKTIPAPGHRNPGVPGPAAPTMANRIIPPARETQVGGLKRYAPDARGSIDLPVLYRKPNGQTIYRLTDLYLPRDPDVRSRILSKNQERMRPPGARIGSESQLNKRKLKEEVKKQTERAMNMLSHQSVRVGPFLI